MRGIRWSLVVGAVLILGGCGSPEFIEFQPQGGGYKVRMPGTPKEQTQQIEKVTLKGYTYQVEDKAYLVQSSDAVPELGDSPAEIESYLDECRNAVFSGMQARLIKTENIKLADKYPGREFWFDMTREKVIFRARIYFARKRLYQVGVVGPSIWVGSPQATNFLDSFTLTE
jgi:hypothetical protein